MIFTESIGIPTIKDPLEVTSLDAESLLKIRMLADDGSLKIIIPDHLIKNKEMRIYKVGFLNELYKTLSPSLTPSKRFNFVKKNYHIFIDIRQYQLDIKDYRENKYNKYVLTGT